MSTPEFDRLDRLEVALSSIADSFQNLIVATENQLRANEARDTRLDRMEAQMSQLVEAQLAGEVFRGQLAEQTLQLKRAVDYLLSKDGGQA